MRNEAATAECTSCLASVDHGRGSSRQHAWQGPEATQSRSALPTGSQKRACFQPEHIDPDCCQGWKGRSSRVHSVPCSTPGNQACFCDRVNRSVPPQEPEEHSPRAPFESNASFRPRTYVEGHRQLHGDNVAAPERLLNPEELSRCRPERFHRAGLSYADLRFLAPCGDADDQRELHCAIGAYGESDFVIERIRRLFFDGHTVAACAERKTRRAVERRYRRAAAVEHPHAGDKVRHNAVDIPRTAFRSGFGRYDIQADPWENSLWLDVRSATT